MTTTQTLAHNVQAQIRTAATQVKTGYAFLAALMGNPNMTIAQIEQLADMVGDSEKIAGPLPKTPAVSNASRVGRPRKTSAPTEGKKLTLRWAMVEVLQDSNEPMSADQITKALEAKHYFNPGVNGKSMVTTAFANHKDIFERVDRGLYKLAAGVTIPEAKVAPASPDVPKAEESKPGSTRTRRSSDALGSDKNKILQVLRSATEGLNVGKIAEKLNMEVKAVSPILKAALETNEVRKEGDRRGTVYFIGSQASAAEASSPKVQDEDFPVSEEDEPKAEFQAPPPPEKGIDLFGKVHAVLAEATESISVADIGKAAGIQQLKSIALYLEALKSQGVVSDSGELSPTGQKLFDVDQIKLNRLMAAGNHN